MADPSLDRASQIIQRQEQLAAVRFNFENYWQQVAERVLPRDATFLRRGPLLGMSQGEARTEKIFDSTAQLAAERCAAAVASLVTPRTQRWHGLAPSDPRLRDVRAVKLYCEELTDILFQARYSLPANFESQVQENYLGLVVFGTGILFTDDALGEHLRYRAIHLSECFIAENHVGMVDTVYRKFSMTARQAMQRFGEESLPRKIVQASRNAPESEFEFIHCVEPRADRAYGRADWRGMPITSDYVAIDGRQVVNQGGYRTFPYAVSRWVTGPRETYGRSPAMTVLGDIKMLNEMSKTTIRAAQKIVDPPMLLQEDGVLQQFNLRPGALNYGGIDEQGREVVKPLITGARIDIGLQMMDQRRKSINDANLVTLFQILVQNPQMTATEAMLRAQEQGILFAPTMGRQQTEMGGPTITREIDILAIARILPPMPPELQASGGRVDIEYSAPLNRLMRASDGVAIMRTIEGLAPLAQIDPSVMAVFHPERTARILADINGVLEKALRSPEEMVALEQEKAQQAQAQMLLQAAPVASKAAKDLMDANATAQNIPQPQPGVGA